MILLRRIELATHIKLTMKNQYFPFFPPLPLYSWNYTLVSNPISVV